MAFVPYGFVLVQVQVQRGCHFDITFACLIEKRLLGNCLCSAESTSMVVAIVVGVLDVFTPEVEMLASSVGFSV
jgi:hypothetical protein